MRCVLGGALFVLLLAADAYAQSAAEITSRGKSLEAILQPILYPDSNRERAVLLVIDPSRALRTTSFTRTLAKLTRGSKVRNEKLRLVRINAPEMTGPDQPQGVASRDFLRSLIDGKEVIIETVKDQRGKYGRYLAEIWIEKNGGWINVNDALVTAGHAVYQEY